MSGYARYSDAHDRKYGDPHPVPIVPCTAETLGDLGRLVFDFDQEEVWITTWPQPGWRPICEATGNQGGVTSGDFRYRWVGDELHAVNEAVGGNYVTGRLAEGSDPNNREFVLTRELNYHPDGGQVFFPTSCDPFVMILAPPGDDIQLSDFRAFYCDGSCGLQIKAGVWHQPVYPVADEALYKGKQGRVHACVKIDTVDEFGKFLKAGVWHQAAYPSTDTAVFKGKQGRVHASVAVDTVNEFGKFLKIPLKLPIP